MQRRIAPVRNVRIQDLALAYQPIIDVQIGRIVAVEALVRAIDRESGRVLLPDSFLSQILATQCSMRVTRWIFGSALSQLSQWRARGFDWLRICLNVTVAELADPRLLDVVRRAAHGIVPPRNVEIEVCEHGPLLETPSAIATLQRLRKDGFRVAVDDFGSGSASLRYLLDIPATTIKFDRYFMLGASSDPHATVLTAAAELSERLGYDVVVEGVETLRHLNFAIDRGLRYVQGYYLGYPMPAEALTDRLRTSWTPRGERNQLFGDC